MTGPTVARPLPSARALRAAAVLARCGSFTAAAERLNVTRSAVSHLIRELEIQLGAQLFERTSAGAVPTERGRVLIGAVEEPLAQLEGAVAAFRRDRLDVRLSTLSSLAEYWLIPRLPAFHAARPEIRVTVATSVQPVDFAREDYDCAIRHGRGGWPGLESVLLFRESLALVGLPQAVARCQPDDVAGFLSTTPYVAISSRPDDLRAWWRALRLPGHPPAPVLTVETRAQAIAAALSGAGVALIDPRFLAARSPAAALAAAPAPVAPLETGYHLVAPPRRFGRKNVDLLRRWIVAEAERG